MSFYLIDNGSKSMKRLPFWHY